MARHNPIYVNPYRHPEDTGVHVVSREINLGALGLADGEFPIGAAEKNAIPLRAGVRIITAFNAGTTNVLTIGTEADDDAFITSANAGADTIGTKAGTGAGLVQPLAADTVFYASFTQTGTAATTGRAIAWVEFIVPRTEDPRDKAGV
jgi:hypothetical protein